MVSYEYPKTDTIPRELEPLAGGSGCGVSVTGSQRSLAPPTRRQRNNGLLKNVAVISFVPNLDSLWSLSFC